MAKRPCCSSEPNPLGNPRVSKPEQMDHLLEAFLNLYDSSTLSLDLSFNRLLESRGCESDQNQLIERALRLGSALLEAGKRSARKRDSKRNSIAWPLPPDLTTKVLSFLWPSVDLLVNLCVIQNLYLIRLVAELNGIYESEFLKFMLHLFIVGKFSDE